MSSEWGTILEQFSKALSEKYPQRNATGSEQSFFSQNPHVAGYAAPDKAVVLNPSFQGYSPSVLTNERLRLWLQEHPTTVPNEMTILPHQVFSPEYQSNPTANRHSILSRLLSGDPSGAPYTAQQHQAGYDLLERILGRQSLHKSVFGFGADSPMEGP
mgnify:CR=1 FL=1